MEPMVAAAVMCMPITAGRMPEPVAVVDAFIEAYNKRDIAGVRAVLAADARIVGPATDPTRTGAQLAEQYETGLFPRIPRGSIAVSRKLADGDMVAQLESWVIEGEKGSALSAYRVDRGCIVEMSYSK